jgi:hypothetical protein
MTTGRDTSSKADSVTIAAIEAGAPRLVEAREIRAKFHSMLRQKAAAELALPLGAICRIEDIRNTRLLRGLSRKECKMVQRHEARVCSVFTAAIGGLALFSAVGVATPAALAMPLAPGAGLATAADELSVVDTVRGGGGRGGGARAGGGAGRGNVNVNRNVHVNRNVNVNRRVGVGVAGAAAVGAAAYGARAACGYYPYPACY